MDTLILIVAMLVVGMIIGWLAGPIWKHKRPIGTGGDYMAAVVTAIAVGLMDWYVIPAMGFSDNLRNLGVAIEPALGALLVLWIIRAAKKKMTEAFSVIETNCLTRDYKTVRAVNQLTLKIVPGELFGLVGPDGAGKTTTLRLLAGLLEISDGDASVLGFDLKNNSESIKPHIGYMAQQFSLYGELSVMENLQFFAELFDVTPKDMTERTGRLLTFAGLTDFKERRAANLSGGMQKKLALICTLIHQPELLLLDEPTTGVDPISRREFWNILSDLHLQGTTIMVSTPYMDEADRCSRVGLMYNGKLVECDSPKNIVVKLGGDVIEIQPEDWQKALKTVAGLSGVREVQTYGESIHLLVDPGKHRLPEIERALRKEKLAFRSIRIAPARMEEAFISLISKLEM